MTNKRILELTREIRDLYQQNCTLADTYNEQINRADREFKEQCRAKGKAPIAELERFETIFDRQEALKRAYEEPAVKRMRQFLWMSGWSILFFANLYVLSYVSSIWIVTGLTFPLAILLMIADQKMLFFRTAVQQSLRRQLVDRGHAICLSCGYDLRGQCEARCPECGTACAAALIKNRKEAERCLANT